MDSGMAMVGYELLVRISPLQILGQQQTQNNLKWTINNQK